MRHLRVWFLHCHGVDWVITKVQNGIGDGNDNIEVFLCSPMPTPLPINYPSYPSLSRDDLVGNYLGKSSGFLISKNHHWADEYETYWVEFTALFNNRRKREARSPTQLYNILSIEIGLSASSFYRRQESPRRASIDKIIERVEKEENK
ncbi:hypothetical protein RhiirC2_869563 [Rhizophagus irregularis]|uniref:Uncharacterized protein n=1 Tax=Rhizophagus irregularis TaxID=588596 RepID=A0A2N1MQI6_9GLOM|nr:hypothetical protein RhiirC2_869563 [Rhizophagus irregularis]